MAKRRKRPRPRARSRRRSHEHLRAVHCAPDRDRAADGRPVARGLAAYPLLPIAALPNVNYPTVQVTAQLPGADPQTMAASVATPLETQFGQIPGLTQMTSASALGLHPDHAAVRPEPPHRWSGLRHARGHQCRKRPAAAGPAVSTDDPEGQSGGHADPGARPDLRYPAAHHGRCLCGKHPAAEDFADIRRRPGRNRRPAKAVRSGFRWTRRRWRRAASASRTSAVSSARPLSTCRRARSTVRARAIRSTPMISCSIRAATMT